MSTVGRGKGGKGLGKGGGAKSMSEFFVELMGREPNPDNLLRLNGINN